MMNVSVTYFYVTLTQLLAQASGKVHLCNLFLINEIIELIQQVLKGRLANLPVTDESNENKILVLESAGNLTPDDVCRFVQGVLTDLLTMA